MLAIKTNVVLRQGTYHMGNSWEKTEKEAGEGKGGGCCTFSSIGPEHSITNGQTDKQTN